MDWNLVAAMMVTIVTGIGLGIIGIKIIDCLLSKLLDR
jgi:hypothetical protein